MKQLNKTATLFAVCIMSVIFPLSAIADKSKNIELVIPEISSNGSFVVKVFEGKEVRKNDNSKIELWRSYEGGQFELISSHPQFDAVSQMVYRQGRYAYQARIVASDTQKVVSETAYIDVNLRYPSLATRFQP